MALAAAATLALVAGATFAGAARPPGKKYQLAATLSVRNEVHAKDARSAHGLFSATLTLNGTKGTLAWRLTFSGLSGPAAAAHVHVGPAGKEGPIAIPLCSPCSSGAHGSFTGPIGGNTRLLLALLHGGTYANVHTKLNPLGEIRGQIRATPIRLGY